MIAFLIANAVARLFLSVLCIAFVHQYRPIINRGERIGLGITAGGSLLTLGLIFDPKGPMEAWTPTVLSFGILTFLIGLRVRYSRHHMRNAVAVEEARRYLEAKGKL